MQHSFLPKRSCVSQLLTSIEYWTDEIQKGNPVDDFKKTFNKVPHERLLIKLKAYGITSKLLNWINSFLKGRKQRVTINSFKSTWTDVVMTYPKCYLIPVYYLQMHDTKIYSHIRNEDDIYQLQQDIDKLLRWSEK